MRISEIATPDRNKVISAIKFSMAKDYQIYKGSESPEYSGNKIFFRNPLDHRDARHSANTNDFVNAFVSGHPDWQAYPPRNRSLICSSDKSIAAGYGDVAVVIPLEDTKIGVCPENDWWECFSNRYDISVDILNKIVEMAINELPNNPPERKFLERGVLTYRDVVKLLYALDVVDIDVLSSRLFKYPNEAMRQIKEHEWFSGMSIILNPKSNGFSLVKWSEWNGSGINEVWLSAPCVMVPFSLMQKLREGTITVEEAVDQS